MKPILYESHMHTPLCRHATGEPEEYAAVAQQRGLAGIIVTCHNPHPDPHPDPRPITPQSPRVWQMYAHEWEEYIALVERARQAWKGRVDVRLGLEANYWPGLEPFLEKQLQSTELHHVLGSVHPQNGRYREQFWTGDEREYQRTYFDHLAVAAETGLFDTISHPDLVKNYTVESWNVKEILPDVQRALDRIAATGTAMELNTSGIQKTIAEMNPGYEILCEMRKRDIPVVLGSDAHVPQRVADGYEDALSTLERAGYTKVSFFLDRRRREVPIIDALSSLC